MNLQNASLSRIQRCCSSLTKIGSAQAFRICARSGASSGRTGPFFLPPILDPSRERDDGAMNAFVEETSYVADVVEAKSLFVVDEGALERGDEGVEPCADGEDVPRKCAESVARKAQLGDHRPIWRQRAQLGDRREARAPSSMQRRANRDESGDR